MYKTLLLLGLIACLVFHAPGSLAMGAAWNLNDVSFLFRLPQGGAQAVIGLLGPQDRGDNGSLLPSEVYRLIPTLLVPGNGNETLFAKALRVISVRIDPCPTLEIGACHPEIRLVWQPVEYDRFAQRWTARDAAVHCVYAVSDTAFAGLKQDLWRLKLKYQRLGVRTEGRALGIHPALMDARTANGFRADIHSIVLDYAGGSTLRKVTFAALLVPQRWWRFGLLEKDAQGQWRRGAIPRLDGQSVDVFNVAVDDGIGLGLERGVDAIFNVLPDEYPEADNLLPVINKGYRFNDDRDYPVFEEKLGAVERFRNPHLSNPDNLDCASCHFADATRHYMSSRFPDLAHCRPDDAYGNPDPGNFNLENTTPAAKSPRVVRAFGFHGTDPVISQRAIHDSAASAHWLNARL